MSLINYASREINCKIVYYGPGLGGKTTNIKYVYSGLVFVADSQADRLDDNIDSLQNMYENLATHGMRIDGIPFVMQWNKRDLPNVSPVEQLDAVLNTLKVPAFPAIATQGIGVFETLKEVSKRVLRALSQQQ